MAHVARTPFTYKTADMIFPLLQGAIGHERKGAIGYYYLFIYYYYYYYYYTAVVVVAAAASWLK